MCLYSIITAQESVYSSPDFQYRVTDIPVPDQFERGEVLPNSFEHWLRQLPLKESSRKVRLYNGELKNNQSAHYRIIDIDIGNKNLQQCADAIIRLRAEYLYSKNRFKDIHFNFTSGDTAKYLDWINGFRPEVKNNQVYWVKKRNFINDYSNFRQYLESVFMYAGSYSLSKELLPVSEKTESKIGDVYIQGGFPGHAIIIIDVVKSKQDNRIAVLLAQSYMPAQNIHILLNKNNAGISPWYIIGEGIKLYTPEWIFEWSDINRFK
jgi:hypothetical protein